MYILGAVPANELLLSTPPQDQPVFHYEPIFIDELLSSANMRPGTSEICGTNKQCQYDYQVTGKQSVAESTVRIKNEFDALKQKLAKKGNFSTFITIVQTSSSDVSDLY